MPAIAVIAVIFWIIGIGTIMKHNEHCANNPQLEECE